MEGETEARVTQYKSQGQDSNPSLTAVPGGFLVVLSQGNVAPGELWGLGTQREDSGPREAETSCSGADVPGVEMPTC